ncbi:MAG: hypothetical protein QG600_188 [Patescibacteria group bacterium]|nr:hypothetical protein [Patescibacteria group bacterium]
MTEISSGDKTPFSRRFIKLRNVISSVKESVAPPVRSSLSEPLMPADIRYAFEYQDGMMGPDRIRSLIQNNFSDIGNYLLLKSFDADPDLQEEYLKNYVAGVMGEDEMKDERIKDIQLQACHTLAERNAAPVNGKKLAKIMVQGVNLWNQRFSEIAEEVADMPTEPTPVYIAYAGVLGLRQGLEVLSQRDREILVLNPDWAKRGSDNVGYRLDPQNRESPVTKLKRGFMRPDDFVFIDDTRSTDTHINEVWDFWSRANGSSLPEDRIRVVYTTPQSK